MFRSGRAPFVSVAIITYNHEKYLRQALDSVVLQQTSFPFEIVLAEDCSTDGTRRIVLEYRDRYPHLINALLPDANRGICANLIACLRACRGRYVALLEGDDYWISPQKLQKQVDRLEAHPELAICASRARVFYEDGRDPWEYPIWEEDVFQIRDLIRENFIPTCTAMYRLGLLLEFPSWLSDLPFCDWPLHILMAQSGDIAVLPETLAVYRVHGQGAWSKIDSTANLKARLRLYELLTSSLHPRHTDLLNSLRADITAKLQGA